MPFVSRGGIKLAHALRAFAIDVAGFTCADLGCNVGGFTDCLLQHGAARVCAVDTAYGELAWKLRNDARVRVLERSNALHVAPPEDFGQQCHCVVIDLGWTRLMHALPAARAWMRGDGFIIALLKPHYEANQPEREEYMVDGAMSDIGAEQVTTRVLQSLAEIGFVAGGCEQSPIRGGKSGRRSTRSGNAEWLVLLRERQ